MKIFAHLLRKDLRGVAIVALIWTVLMAIEVTTQLAGLTVWSRVPQRPGLLRWSLSLLPMTEVAIAALLVSLVIHDDPLVDARAFWLTRPVPRGRLFAAKLATIALVIFTPALVGLAVLLAWYHVPPIYMMRAGLEVVLWLACPLLIFTIAATLTSTLSRYALVLFGMFVSALVFIGLMASLEPTAAQSPVFEPRMPRFDDPAPEVTVVLLLVTGFCVTLHRFYRDRDWRVAAAGVAAVIAVGFGVARYFPDFRFFAAPGTARGAWTTRVKLRLLDDQTLANAYHPRELQRVAAPLVLEGLPEGFSATPITLNGQLTRADGTVLRSERASPMQVLAKGRYQASMAMPHPVDPIDAGPTKWEAWPVLLALPSGHREAVRRTPAGSTRTAGAAPDDGQPYYAGSYEGVFLYQVARHEMAGTLRLQQRERITDGPRGIRVTAAEDYKDTCNLTLEVSQTELTLASAYEPEPGYFFVDRQTRRRLRAERRRTTFGIPGPLRAGLRPGHRIFTVAYVDWGVENPHDGNPGDISSPCGDTDLIFVRTIEAGSLTRAIKLADFHARPSEDSFFRR